MRLIYFPASEAPCSQVIKKGKAVRSNEMSIASIGSQLWTDMGHPKGSLILQRQQFEVMDTIDELGLIVEIYTNQL